VQDAKMKVNYDLNGSLSSKIEDDETMEEDLIVKFRISYK
jgi:hypothetical protein